MRLVRRPTPRIVPRLGRWWSDAARSPRWFAVFALVVTAGVTVQRIAMIDHLHDQGHFTKYLELADRVAGGVIPVDRLNDVSPLFLWLTVLVHSFGRVDFEVLRMIQLTAVGLAAVLIATVTYRLGGAVAGGAALAVVVANRAAWLNATEVEPETLILLLGAAALMCLLWSDRPAMRLATGLLLGASVATRPVVLAPLTAIVIWLWWQRWRETGDRRGLGRLLGSAPLALLSGAAVVVLAMTLVTWRITGDAVVMNPGTVFYEGMNARATGYGGVEPRVVQDVQRRLNEPDPLHVAYRRVASAAMGHAAGPEETNRYWTDKALAFAGSFPGAAIRLTLLKGYFALHSHDAWDLVTVVRKQRELSPAGWIPWGFVVPLALVGVLATPWRLAAPAGIYLLASAAPLIVFYVTARQRNALLPAAAVLAGLGVAALLALARTHSRRTAALLSVLVVLTGVLLTQDRRWQREDEYRWTVRFASETLDAAARSAADRRRPDMVNHLLAEEATWWTGTEEGNVAELRGSVSEAARRAVATGEPARMFDGALALLAAGRPTEAEQILLRLRDMGYRPWRGNAAVGSVDYYLALTELRSGRGAEALVNAVRAGREAPGDARALALSLVLSRSDRPGLARRLSAFLNRVHDPFTVELALASSEMEAGVPGAAARIGRLRAALPEWRRPDRFLALYPHTVE